MLTVKQQNSFSSYATSLYSESVRLESLLSLLWLSFGFVAIISEIPNYNRYNISPPPSPAILQSVQAVQDPAPTLHIPGALSPQVEQPTHKAEHSPLFSVEDKNG
jgi:hypothetical protein